MPSLYTVFLKSGSLDLKRAGFPQEFTSFMKEQICQSESYLTDVYINLTSCKTLPLKLNIPPPHTHTHIYSAACVILLPQCYFSILTAFVNLISSLSISVLYADRKSVGSQIDILTYNPEMITLHRVAEQSSSSLLPLTEECFANHLPACFKEATDKLT